MKAIYALMQKTVIWRGFGNGQPTQESVESSLKLFWIKTLQHRSDIAKYLRSIDKKIKFIKTSEDLHIIKFAPSRFHKDVFSETDNNPQLIPLDKNLDGQITRIDFTLQQMQRVKENKVIRLMFEEVRSKTKV